MIFQCKKKWNIATYRKKLLKNLKKRVKIEKNSKYDRKYK